MNALRNHNNPTNKIVSYNQMSFLSGGFDPGLLLCPLGVGLPGLAFEPGFRGLKGDQKGGNQKGYNQE